MHFIFDMTLTLSKESSKMNRVAIVGATGYAGAELVRILSGHPEMELTVLTSRQYAGVRFDRVYPAMEIGRAHV